MEVGIRWVIEDVLGLMIVDWEVRYVGRELYEERFGVGLFGVC